MLELPPHAAARLVQQDEAECGAQHTVGQPTLLWGPRLGGGATSAQKQQLTGKRLMGDDG